MSPPASGGSPRSGTSPSQRYWPATIASQASEPSVIETSTTWPLPERRASFSAARIPTAAISPPPPRSAIWPAGLDRRAVPVAGQPEDAVQAQVVLVVPGAVAVRAVLAVAGDRAVDERRVRLRAARRSRRPRRSSTPGRKLSTSTSAPSAMLQQRLLALLLLQVQPDRALVAVQRQVQRRAGPERRRARPRRRTAAPSARSRRRRCPRP